MATKSKKSKKEAPVGGKSLEAQIARLEALGDDVMQGASEIMEQFEPDMIRLAFKRTLLAGTKTLKLTKREEAVLEKIDNEKVREETRAKLLAEKQKAKS